MPESPLRSPVQPEHFREARALVLDVLRDQPECHERALQDATALTRTALRSTLLRLVEDGEVWRSQRGLPPRAAYSLPPVVPRYRPSSEAPLSVGAQDVLSALHKKSDTAAHIARRLRVDTEQVRRALEELEAHGRIVRSYVGMLAIYRTAHIPNLVP